MAHNWRLNTIVIVAFAVGALASNALAVEIGWFPGLKKLIDQSDAIVILRVDHDVDTGNLDSSLTGYTTHDCYIYQSLKGVLPAGDSVRLRLMNTGPGRGPAFGRSYMRFSAHLVFLTKKRNPDEPTEYRTIEIEGANISLPPEGNERLPAGETLIDKVRELIRTSIGYSRKTERERQKFLARILRG